MIRTLFFPLILLNLLAWSANSLAITDSAVHILKEQLEIPDLGRKRTLRIYLPPNYSPDKKPGYPVLYMHDAQNLFDDKTAFAGEWQVDETLDTLAKTHNFHLIVVGIDNGAEKRVHELSAWDHPKYGVGEGEAFTRFIVEVVKPFIDKRYNSNTEDTAIMGSSLGGLSAHYAIYQYPDIFNKAGIFSPSYWYSEQVFPFTAAKPLPKGHRLFFTVGDKEPEQMHTPLDRMIQRIESAGHPKQNLYREADAEGSHNEAFWRRRFSAAIAWLYELKEQ